MTDATMTAPVAGPSRWRTDRSFVDLMRVVRRRLWIVVLAIVAALAGSYALSSSQSPIYAAASQLLVMPRDTGAVFDQSTVTNAQSLERAVETEIRVIEGEVVRARVQRDLGLATTPPAVSASAIDSTDVVSLSVRSGDRRVAQLLADAYAQAYIETRREQAVLSLDSAQAELQVKVGELQAQIAAIDAQVAATPSATRRQAEASLAPQREALVNQQSSFKARLDQFQVDAALTTGGASVVQSAGLPGSPVAPKPLTTAMLAAILGALLGLGAAFALDNVDDSVRGTDDLARLSAKPVLAAVPSGAGTDPRPLALIAPHEPAVESYRELRTNLQFLALDTPLRVLLVTSSAPGEGKTTTASNLAVVLAQAGQRVLVIDADLRRPNVHHVFGLPPVPGLTEVLLGEELDFVVNDTESLHVITAGTVPPNPSELLASERFAAFLEEVAGRYDTVVIDSAPLLPVADSFALANAADGVVLVTQANRTSRRSVEASLVRLTMVKANLVGFVLNRARTSRENGGYGYGAGYGYGYGYGYGEDRRRDDDGLEWTEDVPKGRRWWHRGSDDDTGEHDERVAVADDASPTAAVEAVVAPDADPATREPAAPDGPRVSELT